MYTGIESLVGKKIGCVRGYSYGDEFSKSDKFIREDVTDFFTNIKKLTYKVPRIDLTLEDEIVGRVIIAKNAPQLLSEVVFCDPPVKSIPLYVAANQTDRGKKVIELFNEGLGKIMANGEYKVIMTAYGL